MNVTRGLAPFAPIFLFIFINHICSKHNILCNGPTYPFHFCILIVFIIFCYSLTLINTFVIIDHDISTFFLHFSRYSSVGLLFFSYLHFHFPGLCSIQCHIPYIALRSLFIRFFFLWTCSHFFFIGKKFFLLLLSLFIFLFFF